jgi:hypothetical protein
MSATSLYLDIINSPVFLYKSTIIYKKVLHSKQRRKIEQKAFLPCNTSDATLNRWNILLGVYSENYFLFFLDAAKTNKSNVVLYYTGDFYFLYSSQAALVHIIVSTIIIIIISHYYRHRYHSHHVTIRIIVITMIDF